MKYFVLIAALICCAANGESTRPAGESTFANKPTAVARSQALLDAVYGGAVSADTCAEIIDSFVVAAKQGENGDKDAPVNGDKETKARYYLAVMRAVHDRQWILPQSAAEAQRAADAKAKELRSRLPQE